MSQEWPAPTVCTCGASWPCAGPEWMGDHSPVLDEEPEAGKHPNLQVNREEQPYGPGAVCGDCGHFAGRHGPDGCPGISKHCDCPAMLWHGVRWPRPWLPAPEGLTAR